MRIAVTAAHPRSLHAIAIMHGLAKQGHQIALLVEPKVTVARMRTYLRMLGAAKLKSKVVARMGRPAGSAADEVGPMRAYMADHGIAFRTTAQAARAVEARRVLVRDINDEISLSAVRGADLDLIVYAGGGIIRAPLIASSRMGVLNAHGGPLPAIRGMNAGEWALFHGMRPAVTTHFIDTGIDTGPILLSREVPDWSTIPAMRGMSTRIGVELLLETVKGLADTNLRAKPQAGADGLQFYIMADPLLEVVDQWIREGRTPLLTSPTPYGRR